jgi:DNA-binding response OmpR family regulator
MAGKADPPPVSKEAAVRSCDRIKVLVANESPVFCQAVEKVLSSEPFEVISCNDGKSALAAIEEIVPDVVLLDVALPGMYGFEVCEAVRENPATASVKVILIAAIYDKARYKREPNSLYGADDYIEKHHIPDSLSTKIYQLVSGGRGPAAEGEDVSHEGVRHPVAVELSDREKSELENNRKTIKQDEQWKTDSKAAGEESEAHVKARRFARLIVSDIALYNQERVEEGVRNDGFYELLEEDIQEGRALYEQRIPPEIRNSTSYLDDAFEELISKKKREMNLSMEPGAYGG